MSEDRQHRSFESSATAVGEARRFVSGMLQERHLAASPADILVSELATNVVKHARTAFTVSVDISSLVRVEVSDGNSHLGEAVEADLLSDRGRGLRIVEALSEAWGIDHGATGKIAWFEVRAEPDPTA